jgi:hypothetical protein
VSIYNRPFFKQGKHLFCFLVALYGCTGLSLLAAFLNPQPNRYFFPADHGFDFFCFLSRFPYRHTSEFFSHPGYPWYYPAPAIFAYYPFYVVAQRTTWSFGYRFYAGVTATLCGVAVLLFTRALARVGIGIKQAAFFSVATAVCSWPIYFAVQRGNIEAFTWLILAAGVCALAYRLPWIAAVLIGIAGSIKLYPFLFVALFVRRRQWAHALVATATLIVFTAAALHFLDPHWRESLVWTSRGIRLWTNEYSRRFDAAAWDHSFFTLAKMFAHSSALKAAAMVPKYYLFAGMLALALGIRANDLSEDNLVLFLGCASISLQPASFDYNLSMLYIPFGWLTFRAFRSGVRDRWSHELVFTMLGIALAPSGFLMLRPWPAGSGEFKAICLLMLVVVSATVQLGAPKHSSALAPTLAGFEGSARSAAPQD